MFANEQHVDKVLLFIRNLIDTDNIKQNENHEVLEQYFDMNFADGDTEKKLNDLKEYLRNQIKRKNFYQFDVSL